MEQGTAMLLGGFDGLHAGHRLLLSCAKESGFPVGVMTIIGCKEESIFTFQEREEIFKNFGADFVFDETVTRALSIMNDRMNEDLTVSALAEEVYMSEDGFIRRFSRIMGATPYAYLKKLRLTTAAGMINDGESISTAALAFCELHRPPDALATSP